MHTCIHAQYIKNLGSVENFDDTGPCVVMASPGMLQSGVSREIFEDWYVCIYTGIYTLCIRGSVCFYVFIIVYMLYICVCMCVCVCIYRCV